MKTRLFFVDNLRTLLITLVIMQHLSVTYGGVGGWYYYDGEPDQISGIVLTIHNAINQSFFMGFLFLISGYFTASSYDRKGPWRFVKGRLLRLGIPWLFYSLVINPIVVYMLWIKVDGYDGSVWEYLASHFGRLNIADGPVWFNEALLIFTVFYVLRRKLTKTPTEQVRDNGRMPSNLAIAVTAIALGVVTFIVRLWRPVGWGFTPLNLQLPFFPQYIYLFVVGTIAYRGNWFRRISDATGRLWLCVAIAFIVLVLPVVFVLGGAARDVAPYMGGMHWQCLAYTVWEQIVGIAMIIALLVLFRNRFNRQGQLAKTMSDSSYATYIIHPLVVVFLALAIRHIALYPLLKFALAGMICVPSCFALGNIIRKLPLARRIL
ncbi:MAG: acyltransferase family protein [Phycisphaerales bacterium]|nr:MAG: acyltransferase family protein [Phycisphaerales bacterium]